jgi:hypothetical protein
VQDFAFLPLGVIFADFFTGIAELLANLLSVGD